MRGVGYRVQQAVGRYAIRLGGAYGTMVYMWVTSLLSTLVVSSIFATMPSSTNYNLKSFDLGTGGGSGSSGSYNLNTVTGTQSAAAGSSASYAENPGLAPTTNANVPPAPAFTNPNAYYDRLQLTLATGANPSDTKYAIAISDDDFVTTRYVKSDHSIGATLTSGDRQTYAAWGGASGFQVLGLSASTTYKVKVKAMQGNFTETAYGPTATAATVAPSLTFAVATTASGTPPFAVSFAGLALGTVFSTDADASLSISTNALLGGSLYIKSNNAGLTSALASYTIASASVDLTGATRGYGAMIVSASQSGGGPVSAAAPFNGVGNAVGGVTTGLQQLASSPGAIDGGSLTVRFKAKSDASVPTATDYTDVVTFVAAMAY